MEKAFKKNNFSFEKATAICFLILFLVNQNLLVYHLSPKKTAALRGIRTNSDGSLHMVFADIFYQLNVSFSHYFNYLS